MATDTSPAMQPTSVEHPASDEQSLTILDRDVYVQPGVRHDITEARTQLLTKSFDIAGAGASLGFALAKAGIDLGFGIAKGVLEATDSVFGHASKPVTAPIAASLQMTQFLTSMGVEWGETLAGVTIGAVATSLTTVNEFYGNGEAVRALVAFHKLFVREWNDVLDTDPPGGMAQFSLRQLLRAMSCWSLLQSMTNHLEPFEYSKQLTTIEIRHDGEAHLAEESQGETIFEYAAEDTGDCDEAEIKGDTHKEGTTEEETSRLAFRRYASLCLGSYGGIGLLFLGVPLPPANDSLSDDDGAHSQPFNFWDVLRGAHDRDLMERLGSLESGSVAPDDVPAMPQGRRPPRHFIITDHPARAISLCLRGTLSMDDLATDLACEEAPFPLPPKAGDSSVDAQAEAEGYTVHGGMLEVAEELGQRNGSVVRRLSELLRKHRGYELHIVGHSLGAGIACLLALLWADPDTALTTVASPLPANVRVVAYCFATPCVTSAPLSRRIAPKLVRAIVVGDDVVARFSLGHMRDLRSAAAWIASADSETRKRVFAAGKRHKEDDLALDFDEQDFLSGFRKTLEANMQNATLFPPGTVYLMRPPRKDHRGILSEPVLHRVDGKVEVVFKQIRFSSGLLSDHMPHRYANWIAKYV